MSPVSAPPGLQILGPIAETSTVEVFRALDLSSRREVAVKFLKPAFSTELGRQNFLKGARIQSSLQHPGIIPVHQIGEFSDGRPFVVMQFIRGETLRKLLNSIPVSTSELPQFLGVFEQVCRTIAYAHEHRIIHRNIKPSNVLLAARGEVLTVSWGHATEIDRAEPELVGTPLYMPPEQARSERADFRSDVFGLGGILCEILTGKPPHVCKTPSDMTNIVAAGDLSGAVTRLDECGAPRELIRLSKRCLSPDPADRPADGDEVARSIAGYLLRIP